MNKTCLKPEAVRVIPLPRTPWHLPCHIWHLRRESRDGPATASEHAGPDAGGGGGDEQGPGGPQPTAAGGPPGPGREADAIDGGDGESGRGSGAGPLVHPTNE